MAHGLLFISYIIMAIMLKYEENWTGKKFGIVAMASIIPFGTFYVEKKYLRNKIRKFLDSLEDKKLINDRIYSASNQF